MPPDSTTLGQLAEALNAQGYQATVVTPAPYLALQIPGAILPYMIYNSGGHFWWHNAQVIAPSERVTQAAEVIMWGLRAVLRDPAASAGPPASGPDRTETGQGGGQEC